MQKIVIVIARYVGLFSFNWDKDSKVWKFKTLLPAMSGYFLLTRSYGLLYTRALCTLLPAVPGCFLLTNKITEDDVIPVYRYCPLCRAVFF